MQTMTSKRSAKSAKQPLSCFKIIRTAQDHKSAMERILVLMHLDPPRGTPEFDEMEVLGLLIEKYEEVHFPMNDADPIDMIKFMMDQQGLKKKDLIPYIGSASKVTEVLNGTRSLSLSMIRKLSEGMKIPAGVLIQPVVKKRV